MSNVNGMDNVKLFDNIVGFLGSLVLSIATIVGVVASIRSGSAPVLCLIAIVFAIASIASVIHFNRKLVDRV